MNERDYYDCRDGIIEVTNLFQGKTIRSNIRHPFTFEEIEKMFQLQRMDAPTGIPHEWKVWNGFIEKEHNRNKANIE